jgi:xanthine dehydrogenase accessory factor
VAVEPQPLVGGDLPAVLHRLEAGETAVLVAVAQTQGSAPRERGAWMAVFAHDAWGTIGGGQLEWQAMAVARRLLADPCAATAEWRCPLGPSLGQCCGGVVHLRAWRVSAADVSSLRALWQPALSPLALFGGGHVGRALVRALAPLPFAVRWIDSRDGVFPADVPAQVQVEHSEPVQRAVADLPPGSRVLVMSFSHAEDLDIVAACLERCRRQDDLPFIGLIGSRTKWAAFQHRLEARGFGPAELDRVSCPIGLPGIRGKEPAVIAASVVAQLLLDVSGTR